MSYCLALQLTQTALGKDLFTNDDYDRLDENYPWVGPDRPIDLFTLLSNEGRVRISDLRDNQDFPLKVRSDYGTVYRTGHDVTKDGFYSARRVDIHKYKIEIKNKSGEWKTITNAIWKIRSPGAPRPAQAGNRPSRSKKGGHRRPQYFKNTN